MFDDFQLVHDGKGGSKRVELPPMADLTADFPKTPQKLKRVGSFAMRNPPPLAKAHTSYKPGKLVDLGVDQCRYVLFGDLTMCGAKTHKRDMCQKHYELCWKVRQ